MAATVRPLPPRPPKMSVSLKPASATMDSIFLRNSVRLRSWALALAFLSFIGIPPLAGFAGKLVLFGAAIEAGYAWLAAVAAVNTVISIAYYARVLGPAFFEESRMPQPVLAPSGAAVAAVGAAAVLLVGVTGGAFLGWLEGARLLPW